MEPVVGDLVKTEISPLHQYRRLNHLHVIHAALLALLYIANSLCIAADRFPDDYIAKYQAEAIRGLSVDVSRLAAGEFLTAEFVGRPVFIYRRTADDIARLEKPSDSRLVDPDNRGFNESLRIEFGSSSSLVWTQLLLAAETISKKHTFRSLERTLMVLGGWAPGSGCALAVTPANERTAKGYLFRDPCSGATFDAAGRVFQSPLGEMSDSRVLPINVAVPPYQVERQRVLLGSGNAKSLPTLPFSAAQLYGSGSPTQRLIGAARYNDIRAAREAIRAGADVRYFRPGEGSPLDAAIIGSSMEIVKLLLQHGAKVTPNSENAARAVGRDEVLELLRGAK